MTFADQNLATAVCSGVRALPDAAPYALISSNASTHSPLWRDGGGSGRNWAALGRTNGRTSPTHGVCGFANGGVNLQTPGANAKGTSGDENPIGVSRPSPLRRSMISLAAAAPTDSPSVFD